MSDGGITQAEIYESAGVLLGAILTAAAVWGTLRSRLCRGRRLSIRCLTTDGATVMLCMSLADSHDTPDLVWAQSEGGSDSSLRPTRPSHRSPRPATVTAALGEELEAGTIAPRLDSPHTLAARVIQRRWRLKRGVFGPRSLTPRGPGDAGFSASRTVCVEKSGVSRELR